MVEVGSPIKLFIEQAKEQAIAGLGDWELKKPITLELSTIVSGKVGGSFDIQVINFGAKVNAEQIQKISFLSGKFDFISCCSFKSCCCFVGIIHTSR